MDGERRENGFGCWSMVAIVLAALFVGNVINRFNDGGPAVTQPAVDRPAPAPSLRFSDADLRAAREVIDAGDKMERLFDAIPGASRYITTCNVTVGDRRFNVFVSDAFFALTASQRQELMTATATLWRGTKFVREDGYSPRVTFWGRRNNEPWFEDAPAGETVAAAAESSPSRSEPPPAPELTPGQRAWAQWSKDQEDAEKDREAAKVQAAAKRATEVVSSIKVISFGPVHAAPTAFVRLLPSKRTLYVKIGDVVGGWTIKAIDRKAMSVTVATPDGDTMTLSR